MQNLLNRLVDKNSSLTQMGRIATYIPALSKANPNDLGACVVDLEGNQFNAGVFRRKFTIQSISKTVSLMLAMLDNDEADIFEKVGMEPTGDPFNSIVKLETEIPHRPFNPMINAGAIVISSLIAGEDHKEKMARLLDFYHRITLNHDLHVNQEVYLSEKRTGDKNRAMAYYMKSMGVLEGDVEQTLDVYFKQCSIEVDCVDIARIGLFIANDGVIPETGEQLVPKHITQSVKSFMVTCGMYNGSGEFAMRVGIPAKSGVGGGIMAAVPGKMGIGVFGPALDGKGNSIGGLAVLRDLSQTLDLSIF